MDIKDGIVHEIKKSNSFEDSHVWQVLFYLFHLKKKGVSDLKGEIHYPKRKKKVVVTLTKEKEVKLLKIMNNIREIVTSRTPPPITAKLSVCKKCSYYELCWIE